MNDAGLNGRRGKKHWFHIGALDVGGKNGKKRNGYDMSLETEAAATISGMRAQRALGFPVALSYKDELTKAMDLLAEDPLVRFVGYGVKIGRAMGTLKNVPDNQLIEMPVAENLLVGFAIGLSLKGLKPVVFIERFDFWWNASDAIVNHLDKMAEISRGEFTPSVILRIVVGNRQKPLFTGETHTQDYSPSLRSAVSFPVIGLHDASQIVDQYKWAHSFFGKRSTAIIEFKDNI